MEILYFRGYAQEIKKSALLNAFPPRYFSGIESGKRLYSSIPLAYTSAGYPLFTQEDFFAGRALSADFTGHGWRSMLKIAEAPIMSAREAGEKLAGLAQGYDFSMFEYWASDYAGHKQDMDWAVEQMEVFDGVLEGLIQVMGYGQGFDPGHVRPWQHGRPVHPAAYGCESARAGDRQEAQNVCRGADRPDRDRAQDQEPYFRLNLGHKPDKGQVAQ